MKGQDLQQVPVQVRLGALAWALPEDLGVFFVPYDPGRANPNRIGGRHWSRRHQEAEPAQLAAMWAYRVADDPVFSEPATVDILIFRGRELDDDNAKAGLKAVRDYLFKGRALPDDQPRWVRYREVRQVIGLEWAGARAWTVLLVRRREPAP